MFKVVEMYLHFMVSVTRTGADEGAGGGGGGSGGGSGVGSAFSAHAHQLIVSPA